MKTLFIVTFFVSTLLTIVFAQNLEDRATESDLDFAVSNAVSNAVTTRPVVRDNRHVSHLVPWWLEPLTCSACHETYWLVRD